MLLQVVVAAAVLAGQPEGRQGDFAAAAREYGVPVSVLLGLSYLQSRWDAHPGEPSTAGGYGPMHLVDPSLLTGSVPLSSGHSGPVPRAIAPGHDHGDARGDTARPLPTGTRHSHTPSGPDTARPSHALSGHLFGADTGAPSSHALSGQLAESGTGARLSPSLSGHLSEPGTGTLSLHPHPLSGQRAGTDGGVLGATVDEAARLTGISAERLRRDPTANIRGGAALLASYQRVPSTDPAQWHAAVARYAGSRAFADEVLRVIRDGVIRRTDDGSLIRLPAHPGLRSPARPAKDETECPRSLNCEWMPAAYAKTGKGGYGNHDRLNRPRRIDYIVIHDTEGPFTGIPRMVQNPKYVSWHYTIRSRDGHIAQHVRTGDIAWHAGNWDVNTRSIGIEHEGYLAKGGTWYTEAMYRASARLVRHLAAEHRIPLDRAHILGHDNVPGTTPDALAAMHEDPGPYWDWSHYFDLLGAPLDKRTKRLDALADAPSDRPDTLAAGPSDGLATLTAEPSDGGDTQDARRIITLAARPSGPINALAARARPSDELATSYENHHLQPAVTPPLQARDPYAEARPRRAKSVVILPEYDEHRPRFTGCKRAKPRRACPPHGASSVWLHTEPRHDAPLVDDIGKRVGKPSTYSVYDHSARASAGQRFALAERRGEWTAIWYLGRKAWFHDPKDRPAAVPARGPVVVPRGPKVKVYGRAYPEKSAYRGTGVDYQAHVPLPYRIGPGQAYTVGDTVTGLYHSAAYRPAKHVTVKGDIRYYQIQLGHRVAFVKAEDVRLRR